MSKTKERLKMIRMYKEETGNKDIEHHEVAAWAEKRGWQLPVPPTPIELLARELSAAARTETRTDLSMGFPYRAYHAYPLLVNGKQEVRWVDVDEKPSRKKMQTSLTIRRNQTAADVIQMTFDGLHWSNDNPKEEPITPPADFTFDVEMAMAALANATKKKAS